jgi:hypothetical protein
MLENRELTNLNVARRAEEYIRALDRSMFQPLIFKISQAIDDLLHVSVYPTELSGSASPV